MILNINKLRQDVNITKMKGETQQIFNLEALPPDCRQELLPLYWRFVTRTLTCNHGFIV